MGGGGFCFIPLAPAPAYRKKYKMLRGAPKICPLSFKCIKESIWDFQKKTQEGLAHAPDEKKIFSRERPAPWERPIFFAFLVRQTPWSITPLHSVNVLHWRKNIVYSNAAHTCTLCTHAWKNRFWTLQQNGVTLRKDSESETTADAELNLMENQEFCRIKVMF